MEVADAVVERNIELLRDSGGSFDSLSVGRESTVILPLLLELRGFPLELGRLGHVKGKLTRAPGAGQNGLPPRI